MNKFLLQFFDFFFVWSITSHKLQILQFESVELIFLLCDNFLLVYLVVGLYLNACNPWSEFDGLRVSKFINYLFIFLCIFLLLFLWFYFGNWFFWLFYLLWLHWDGLNLACVILKKKFKDIFLKLVHWLDFGQLIYTECLRAMFFTYSKYKNFIYWEDPVDFTQFGSR